ncbi:MAG: ABC transporter substrate-binding protein [Ornithinibacter sp.]
MTGSSRRRRRIALTVAGGVAVALTASGCLQDPNPSGGQGGAGLGGFVDGGSADGDKTVTILGAFGGDEQKQFEASLVDFEKESGINVQYTADTDFTTTIKQKVNSGDSPDIGLFPQPGGLVEFAAQGKVNPIDAYLDYDKIDATLVSGMLDSSRYQGRVYGAPMRLAVKSLVWYPKPSYEDKGYSTEPKTIQDLEKTTTKIKGDGVAPWCMGWESDQATGWVGTDWIEELVLRMYGPDVYDQWVKHQIPFNDERIVKAFDEFGKIAKGEGEVLGGTKGILNTAFADAMNPAFSPDPKCYLMRQGNFATGFFPAPVQQDLDGKVGIFVYPRFEGGYDGQAILGGGDIAALFNGNDDDAKKVMEFITSDKFGAPWAKAGGWLSPHTSFDSANYPDELTRQMAKIAADADVFRFDGSDVMPKEVGSGTFWTAMVQWVSGKSSQEVTDEVEASWPEQS